MQGPAGSGGGREQDSHWECECISGRKCCKVGLGGGGGAGGGEGRVREGSGQGAGGCRRVALVPLQSVGAEPWGCQIHTSQMIM